MRIEIDEEKTRGFKFRLKIFFWYLCTEPYRQFLRQLSYLKYFFLQFNKTLTWAYVATIIMVVAFLTGKKFVAALFVWFLLLALLLWEWQSGTFMYRYRIHMKQKYKKEREEKQNELDTNNQ